MDSSSAGVLSRWEEAGMGLNGGFDLDDDLLRVVVEDSGSEES